MLGDDAALPDGGVPPPNWDVAGDGCGVCCCGRRSACAFTVSAWYWYRSKTRRPPRPTRARRRGCEMRVGGPGASVFCNTMLASSTPAVALTAAVLLGALESPRSHQCASMKPRAGTHGLDGCTCTFLLSAFTASALSSFCLGVRAFLRCRFRCCAPSFSPLALGRRLGRLSVALGSVGRGTGGGGGCFASANSSSRASSAAASSRVSGALFKPSKCRGRRLFFGCCGSSAFLFSSSLLFASLSFSFFAAATDAAAAGASLASSGALSSSSRFCLLRLLASSSPSPLPSSPSPVSAAAAGVCAAASATSFFSSSPLTVWVTTAAFSSFFSDIGASEEAG
mmetsp:Transcript_1384/g.4038  ORF Transcript_1384/g.4038 Transcript_1384/m.4038 type:complete len:339 (+) Transcript_1384:778-1794(+)